MVTALLDVNVLIALAWPNHQHHKEVKKWFNGTDRKGWATCPITQNGFIRISSNPEIIESAVTVLEAMDFLMQLTNHPEHQFLQDSLDFSRISPRPDSLLQGYRQVTDAYLVCLAARSEGVLVTLDRHIINAVKGTEFEDSVKSALD